MRSSNDHDCEADVMRLRLGEGSRGARPAERNSTTILHRHKFILVRLRKATETSVEIVLSRLGENDDIVTL